MIQRRLFRLAVAGLLASTACSGGGQDPAGVVAPPPTSASPATGPPTTLSPATEASCPDVPDRVDPEPERSRYVLTVVADPEVGVVDGDMSVKFTPDLPTEELVMRLWPNGPRPSAAGTHLETWDLTVDGDPASDRLVDPTTLVVEPGRTIDAGETVEVALSWSLRVPAPANDRLSLDSGAMRLGSFFPILAWEPGVGWARDPAVRGFSEASTAAVADFDLTVDVPAGYQVLASGTRQAGTNHFVGSAIRDLGVSIGRFDDLVSGIAHAPQRVEVTVGVHAGTMASAQAYFDKVVDVLEDFGRRFGPYPWPTFTLAITPGLGGGIEYPSHVMQGPFTLGGTTSHEVGHMWFYGLVGNNQGRDPWLDEGLATWAEINYEGLVAERIAEPVPPAAVGRLGEPMTYWDPLGPVYYDGVYLHGAKAMSSLGRADLVDCALRIYVAQNAHRIATPRDLVSAAAAVFPDATETFATFGVSP